jgi:hypothetical protein
MILGVERILLAKGKEGHLVGMGAYRVSSGG